MLKWFFAASSALLSAQGVPEVEPPIPETIEIATQPSARMTIPVMVAGQGPYDFIVDTGSQGSTISQTITSKLGLVPDGNIRIIAAASTVDVPTVKAPQIQFGSTILDDRDLPVLQRAHMGADGIIGLDSLQDLRVQIDFRKDLMEVTRSPEGKGERGYEIVVKANRAKDQLIITDAYVNGVKTAVIVDTGAEGTMGNEALRAKIKTRDRGSAITSDVHGQSFLRDVLIARSLEIHGFELKNLPIVYYQSPVFDALDLKEKPAVILGMRHLRLFDRIAIDFSSGKILFDLPRPDSEFSVMYGGRIGL